MARELGFKRGEVRDFAAVSFSGYVPAALSALVFLAGAFIAVAAFLKVPNAPLPAVLGQGVLGLAVLIAGSFIWQGTYTNEPNQAAVLTFFGKYAGTDSAPGLRWANPLYRHERVSVRTNITETSSMKVNDANGNPIEIAAAVSWHVDAPAKAALQVEHYKSFVKVQSETCVRAFASEHPYDEHDDPDEADRAVAEGKEPKPARKTLLGGGSVLAEELKRELSERLAVAGIVVEEARVTHLAYAPEIAPAMLRRQQAQAVVAAKRTIVTGAVSMVESALNDLKARKIEVDPDRTAALVSNLLVVLVSDREAVPVVNAGSIHG